MKAKEIRNTEKSAINDKIAELKKELIKLNAQIAIGSAIKNPSQIKKIKKTIARIITVQHENNTNQKKEVKKQEASQKG